MSIGRGRNVAWAAFAMIGSFVGAGAAAGGDLTATFTATPSSLEEGGSSEFRLALQYVPAPSGTGQGTEYAQGRRFDYFNSGDGALTSLVGSVDPGQGGSIDVSSSLNSVVHEVVKSVVYDDPGVYTASVSGTATAYDQRSAKRYKRHPVFLYWMTDGFVEDYAKTAYVLPIDASVDVSVANANPTITNIAWSPATAVGIPFSFTVTASDPGGAAPSETIAFAFDLDEDGEFDDLVQSGSFVVSGTHSFAEEGTHVLRVRVTDGLGGSTEGSFSVTVGNHAPSVDPVRSVEVEYEGALPEVELSARATDDDGHPLTVKWLMQNADGSWTTQKSESLGSGTTSTFRQAYPFGRTNVRFEAFDGYDTTVVGTTVTVQDTVVPTVAVAEDLRLPTDRGQAFATGVTLPTPVVSDGSGRPVTLTDDAPSKFPLGETIVTWTAVDASGNRTETQQKVIVEDREAPMIEGRSVVRIFTDPGKRFRTIDLTPPTVSDNVSAPKKIKIVGPTKSRYPIGRTLVVFGATDEAGNYVEWRTRVVVVNRKPTARAGADIVVTTSNEAGARVKLDGSRSSDPDKHALKYAWRSPRAVFTNAKAMRPSARFPVGTWNVRLIVTDAAGASHADLVKVTVKLKNAKTRPRGGDANRAFAHATRATQEAVASKIASESAVAGLLHANAAAGLGDAAGAYVRWDEGGSEADAALAYAELRSAQQNYGAVAANALFSAYAETGDDRLLTAYGYAAYGTLYSQADLSE